MSRTEDSSATAGRDERWSRKPAFATSSSILLGTIACLAQPITSAAAKTTALFEADAITTRRNWPDLIEKRRKLPPYDRYRHLHATEWDPMLGPPPNDVPEFPTKKPTPYPTPSQSFTPPPPTSRPVAGPTPRPPTTASPTSQPTTLLEKGCPIDGWYPEMYTITLKDRWGDGWGDGSYIHVRDKFTGEPLYAGTMTAGRKENTEYLCLRAWSCYEVIVTGGQWSDEISWSIDRMDDDTNDELFNGGGGGGGGGGDGVLASGGANYKCNFAITDTSLMSDCSNTCDGEERYPTSEPTKLVITTRPTRAPTGMPTLSDDGMFAPPPPSPPPVRVTRPPTSKPTYDKSGYPDRPVGYFNYDILDGRYGPINWEASYPQCGTGMQSPIHLGPGTNVACAATHEIRTRAAEFSLCDDDVGLFSITPTRLRLDFTAKKYNPETDLPDGFGTMEAQYLEVAYPSLHTIEVDGKKKRFDAEYTIVHDFVKQQKATLISILIDASGSKNARFQDLLDEWSKVSICRTQATEYMFRPVEEGMFRRDLQTNNVEEARSSIRARQTAHQVASKKERNLACAFNIYHRTLMPSTYYYAYQGSLPEPPCTFGSYLPGASEWRVIDKPMIISKDQLSQLKSLIEKGPCRNDQYAQDLGDWRARPTQPSEGRRYWQCQRDAFPLDCERNSGYCNCDATLCPEDFDL